MSFVTLKVSFAPELLPRRFSWLRHHRGFISFNCPVEEADPVAHVHDAMFEVLKRWLAPIRERIRAGEAPVGDYALILAAMRQEWMDWNASAFDVFGIDVARDRWLACPAAASSDDASRDEMGGRSR